MRYLAVVLSFLLICPPAAADAIDLDVAKGPGALEVSLAWTGGTGPYRVYRSTHPAILAQPANEIGTTGSTSFANIAFPANLYFFSVAGAPPGGPPIIDSISPAGASFGDLITINGSGFGEDESVVTVRFTYTEGAETNVAEQRVFWTTGTTMSLAVPFAIPNRVNSVEVVVNAAVSPAVGYFVGVVRDDPTPLTSGNETLAFLDKADALVVRLDAKLDPWFVGTGANTQADVDGLHASMHQIQGALVQLRAHVSGQPASTLRVVDAFVGGPAFVALVADLQRAVDTLQGSPPGTVLCEGAAAQDEILNVLHTIDVIVDIINTVIFVLNRVCAGAILLAIITAGTTGPVAAAICNVANMMNDIVAPIMDAIRYVSIAASGITNAAPKDFIPGSYHVNISHLMWGADPPVVYVQGGFPVEARAYSDFHNANCAPSGCVLDFDITIFGIDVPIDIVVPYKIVDDQALRCTLSNPQTGTAGYTGFASGNDGAICLFNGADVGGPSWERGTYDILTTADCGSTLLGPDIRSFLLVSGPRLFSVNPATAQLGGQVELTGAYMPTGASGATPKGAVVFGADVNPITLAAPNDYFATVPDTLNAAGRIGLRVQGRNAHQTLPFAILPPTLTALAPASPFPTENVHVLGTGFAANPANNVLKLNASPVSILTQTGNNDVMFQVPAASSGGALQLTAMGTYVSNQLALPVAAWAAPTKLSHPERQAFHPVMAVAADGTVGIAWIDRHGDGGAVRLLFTDAEPGDAAFRAPIEITTDVMGPASAPTEPDLAVAPDGRFHLVWVRTNGELALVSFTKGTDPTGEVTVAVPDGVFRDPTIAVEPNGNIHIVAIDVPLDATPHNALDHWRSTDGGASFPGAQELHGPSVDSPWQQDIFHVGDPDLSADAGGVKLAYTRGCFDVCDSVPGTLIDGRGVFTRSTSDGWNWGAPVMVHRASSINGGDLFHPLAPAIANLIMHRRPAITGDAQGAIVAWERPTFGTHAGGASYATLAVCANREPFAPLARLSLTPTAPDYQNDNGLPSLAHQAGPIPQTSVAWVERIPGTSPDRVAGVPRILFNRSTDRLASLGISSPLTPTVPPGDTTTVDGEPTVGVDAAGHVHIVWLSGTADGGVVYYTSTGAPYGDAPEDDPAQVPDDARTILAIDIDDTSTESVNLNGFHGTILYDPYHEHEVRWVGTGTRIGTPHPQHDRPSFSDTGQMLYRGALDFAGPSLVDLDAREHLFASDNLTTGDTMSKLTKPIILPDGRVVAGRILSPGQLQLVISDATSGHFTALTGPFAAGDLELDVTLDGRYLVYEDTTAPVDEIVIFDLSTSLEFDRRPGRNPVWYPFDNSGEFYVAYVLERAVPGPNVEHVLVELSTLGVYDEVFVTGAGGFIGRPAYSPDGGELAFDCRNCGDVAADSEGASTIRLQNADTYVPREPGTNVFSPEFSPASDAIAFMRNDAPVLPDTSMQLMIWHLGDPDAEEHLGPAVGDTPPGFPLNAPRLVWRPSGD